jgi:hypothetical protein
MDDDEEMSNSEEDEMSDASAAESAFTMATVRSIQTAVTTEVMNQVNAHLDTKFEAMQQSMLNMLQLMSANIQQP